jgi:hypothetical protein
MQRISGAHEEPIRNLGCEKGLSGMKRQWKWFGLVLVDYGDGKGEQKTGGYIRLPFIGKKLRAFVIEVNKL